MVIGIAMKIKLKALCIFAVTAFGVSGVKGQDAAVKTNLLYDAALTVNWLLQPEARYWFCDRFSGHFLGAHAHGGQYNAGGLKNNISFLGSDLSELSDYRYQGWFVGAGVAYGYAWILGRHWNLEAELGVGYAYTRYDKFRCVGCGKKLERDKSHHYVGPTKLAVNLVYVF